MLAAVMKMSIANRHVWRYLSLPFALLMVAPTLDGAAESEPRAGIELLLKRYADAVAEESLAGILKLMGERHNESLLKYWTPIFARYRDLRLNQVILWAAVNGERALLRTRFVLTGRSSELNAPRQVVTIDRGVEDFLLQREERGEWRFSGEHWRAVDIAAEIRRTLDEVARPSGPLVLQLVAAFTGGEWFPLRQMRWEGQIFPSTISSRISSQATVEKMVEEELMKAAQSEQAIMVHLFLQRLDQDWTLAAVESVPLFQQEDHAQSGEQESRRLHQAVENAPANTLLHLDYARALRQCRLFSKVLEELQKANGLQPGVVSETELQEAAHLAEHDLFRLAKEGLRFEQAVGVSPLHPRLLLQASFKQYGQVAPSAQECLNRSLWYLRLGEDSRAEAEWSRAQSLMPTIRSDTQREAVKILAARVQRTLVNSRYKPPALLRSELFTVRARPGEPSLPRLLLALECAQHSAYADFGIPLSQTEVVLFPTKEDFQLFASRTAAGQVSELAAAYTDGEEIVTYAQSSADTFVVVAHEYGHVAVKTITNGALIPDWLSEGIACVVQGGYWDYRQRVIEAWQRNKLMTMPQLLAWNFGNDDSPLAYSQANAMVEFLLQQFGKDALLSLLQDLGRGMNVDQAFIKHFGGDQQQVLLGWLRSLAP